MDSTELKTEKEMDRAFKVFLFSKGLINLEEEITDIITNYCDLAFKAGYREGYNRALKTKKNKLPDEIIINKN